MKYTIYKIINKIDGKIYIGKHQTENLDDGYMGSGTILRRAQKKHGIENFVKEIIHVFDNEEDMNETEKFIVTEEFCLREDTYNICVGGQGGFSYINRSNLNGIRGKNHTEESKKKIAQTLTGKPHPKKPRYGVRPFLGKTHTEETKTKMRKPKNIGDCNSQFGTMWITDGTACKKIKSTDIIPEGWYKGRVINMARSSSG
jgi:group I intron endonuclease